MFICNPKFGDICAVALPLSNKEVSNAKLAILILLNPLPSPTNDEPLATITSLPVTNIPPLTCRDWDTLTPTFISNPLLGEITATAEPLSILSNFKSCNDSAGMLNNPLPSPS